MINLGDYTGAKLLSKNYESIERKVVSLYKETGISSLPIDPFAIAKRRGYVVKKLSSLNSSAKQLFSKKELDGINYFDPELQTFVIYYDDSQKRERIRFTLMHEIGHIDLGHKEESELARQMANYYAAYALAPSPLIYTSGCEDFMDVADYFDISWTCADNCLQRTVNWYHYSGKIKPYESELLNLFGEKM